MSGPFFSIVITTYDRAEIVRRCVESCLEQTFSDFEIVVVDDASTDDTVSTLEKLDDQRLRVVVHESNRGMHPSRHTGVASSRGEWIVTIDSDWELFPHTLERLHEIINTLPEEVRIVRSRMLWDDGGITPASIPPGVVHYEAHVRGMEAHWSDYGSCRHRSVFEANPYFENLRGDPAALFELNLARTEPSLYVEDVLGKEYADSPNSWMRGANASEVIPRLLKEAPDMLWITEMTLDEHGAALAQHAPRTHRMFMRTAATQAFLVGDRRTGVRYDLAILQNKKLDPMTWASLVLGILGPRFIARGILAYRRLNPGRR